PGHVLSSIMPSLGLRAAVVALPWLEAGISFQSSLKRVYLGGDSTLAFTAITTMLSARYRMKPGEGPYVGPLLGYAYLWSNSENTGESAIHLAATNGLSVGFDAGYDFSLMRELTFGVETRAVSLPSPEGWDVDLLGTIKYWLW